MTIPSLLKLRSLPNNLPIEGAVRIDLEEGIPILRASSIVLDRIEQLLAKQQDAALSTEEEQELDSYEEIDDYLSFVNRTMRNISLNEIPQASYRRVIDYWSNSNWESHRCGVTFKSRTSATDSGCGS
jgi:uncharacterized protein YnzC (UPF0291/DUF896 family)